MFLKIKNLVISHKKISIIVLILIIVGTYFAVGAFKTTSATTQYVLAKVEKGTIVSSISGSGQVSVLNQVDVKSKVSGDLVWVGIKAGQEVKQGQALMSLDSTDAQKSIADAELDLEEARLQLQQDEAQAPIDYTRKLESLQSAKDSLEKSYEDSFNSISNAFLNFPTVMTGAQSILYGNNFSSNVSNVDSYRSLFANEKDGSYDLVNSLADLAIKYYTSARVAYDANFLDFKNITRDSSDATVEALLKETLETSKLIAQAIKGETNLLDTIIDIYQRKNASVSSIITNFQTSSKTYLTTANNSLTTLLSQKSSLDSAKIAVTNVERDISILQINNPTGDTPLSLQVEQNSVKKKESALLDLKSALSDYIVRAPFDGIIATVDVKKGDSVSSGTALATLITKQKIAEITLNEVDVAKIKANQKVTLTFDAVEDLSITGEVVDVDAIGTVSQGVVNYTVKISFDTEDERIKPGMSVNADIITDTKIDVLLVSSNAIKSQGNTSYVEVFDEVYSDDQIGKNITSTVAPHSQQVEVGLSNDTSTEITSGLKEGDQVVIKIITVSATKTTGGASTSSTKSATSLFGGMGGGPR